MHTNVARVGAALVATAAIAGVVVQLLVSQTLFGSAVAALWVLLGYFTILTNVLVAVVFLVIAWKGPERVSASVLAGTTLSIVLVGVIYYFLLHGMQELSGGSQIANVLLHFVTPVAVPVYWLLAAVKGKLGWRDPLRWAIYPLVYFAYALLRGSWTGKYPYPFIDVAQLGWLRVMVNAFVIAAAYMAAGYLLAAADRGLGTTGRHLR